MSLRGVQVDGQGRCVHHDSDLDVVGFRFPCCDGDWACRRCHDETQDHKATVWPPDRFSELAVVCGVCRSLVAIRYYLDRTRAGEHACPHCASPWNPACVDHHDRYFAEA